MKTKINVKDSLNDDTLDLSISDLQEVPVKEIAAIPKATSLDLSCNSISTLPTTFASSLIHITSLDISRNQLVNLPENFGLLVNLKHLDLFKNKLQNVPLSFGSLRSLKWLDLKENPLLPKIKQVIGPCDDNLLCQAAATNLVNFMKDLQYKVEKEKSRIVQLRKEEQEKMEKKANKLKNNEKMNQNKKNKTQPKNQTNGRTSSEEIVMAQNVRQKNCATKTHKKKSPSLVLKILGAFFKFFLYMALFSVLTVFVISMIDEPTYHNMKVTVNSLTKNVSSRLPVAVVEGIGRLYKLARTLVIMFVEYALSIAKTSYEVSSKYYQILSENEMIQTYAETFKNYCHIIYIKSSEFASHASTEVRSLFLRIYQ